MVTMYIRPDQFKLLKETGEAYASTFRCSNSCFEIKVDIGAIDLNRDNKGLPCNNYYIYLYS